VPITGAPAGRTRGDVASRPRRDVEHPCPLADLCGIEERFDGAAGNRTEKAVLEGPPSPSRRLRRCGRRPRRSSPGSPNFPACHMPIELLKEAVDVLDVARVAAG
jgi:hypothetical protein